MKVENKKRRIIVETGPLHGRAFPDKAEISDALRWAHSLGYKVAIPEPVRVEIEHSIEEKYLEFSSKMKALENQTERHGIQLEYSIVSKDDYLKDYRTRFKQFEKNLEIESIAFPIEMGSPENLFRLAVAKSPPFDESGNSFRDAVIWKAIKDAHAQEIDCEFIFVVQDQRFRELCAKEKLDRLTLLRPDELMALIDADIDQVLDQSIQAKCEALKLSMTGRLNEVDALAGNTVSFPELNVGYNENLEGILGLKSNSVEKVEFLGLSDASKNWVFVAYIASQLEIEVQTSEVAKKGKALGLSSLLERYSRKVGYKKARGEEPSPGMSAVPFIEKRMIDIVLECKVDGGPDAKPENFRIVSVEVSKKSIWEFRGLNDLPKLNQPL